jgi:CDP-2,3-bis-(O-geranylgeranyl)-sn-glycerol synthase
VHDSDRVSYGEVFFALGIAALAAMHPARPAFVYAALVLALADGLAAPVGRRFGRRRLHRAKTLAGSTTFLVVATGVGLTDLMLSGAAPGEAATTAVLVAAVLTLVELVLGLGLDNLVLPPLAAVLVAVHIEPASLLEAALVIAPVLVAGVAHSIVIHGDLVSTLARPLDGGRTLRGRRLFGANKTWRGPIVMAATTAVGALALAEVSPRFLGAQVGDDGRGRALLFGLALALGYSLAELPNSLVKRQLGVAPGGRSRTHASAQYLFDQLDSVLGVVVVLALFDREPAVLVATLVLGFAVHMVFDLLLYRLHVKADPGSPRPAEATA